MNKKDREKELQENELVTWGEKKLEKIKPYFSQILLGILIAFLAFMAITYIIQSRSDAYAAQWRELNNSITDVQFSQNTDRLRDVATEYPDGRAGLWALQLAGDYDMRTGINQLSYDREGGFKLIQKAKETLQQVVDGNDPSDMLKERSRFSLAYACESLGEFEEAKTHYQAILDANEDSSFAGLAKRGLARAANPQMAAAFASFKSFEEVGDAPGPMTPDSPNIDQFPDVDIPPVEQPAAGGGDLEVGNAEEAPMKEETTEDSKQAAETSEPAEETTAPEEKAEPAKEGSTTEGDATEKTEPAKSGESVEEGEPSAEGAEEKKEDEKSDG